jgi:quercetin dioxygenase-like cupin family protein
VEVKSTLKVVDSAGLESRQGVCPGQMTQQLVGMADVPTDRIRVTLATYEAGALEPLHWHPIEAFYFVTSGHATVRDIEGREYAVGPGSFIYAQAGIAGAHEWEVKESLQLIAMRATTESDRKFQFTVDKDSKRSYIELDELARRGGLSFKSHY